MLCGGRNFVFFLRQGSRKNLPQKVWANFLVGRNEQLIKTVRKNLIKVNQIFHYTVICRTV